MNISEFFNDKNIADFSGHRHFRLRRVISILLALICGCTAAFASLGAAAADASGSNDYTVKFSEDFENCTIVNEYVNSVDNTNINYFSPDSLIYVEGSLGSISGHRSLRLYNCDLRWWGFTGIEDDSFRFGFSIKVGRNFNNEMRIILTTRAATSTTDADGGTLLTIRTNQNGNTILLGADESYLFELKKDTVYRITVDMTRGTNSCSLSVNGERTGPDFKFRTNVYGMTGLRFYIPVIETSLEPASPTALSSGTAYTSPSDGEGIDVTATPGPAASFPGNAGTDGSGETLSTPSATDEAFPSATDLPEPSYDNTVLVDDIFISTKGRDYPQKYSIQAPGKMPDIEYSEEAPSKKVRVFVNTKEIDMSKAYITENTVYISAEQFLKGLSIDYNYDKNEHVLTISTNKIRVTAHVPGNEISLNGQNLTLNYPVRTIDDVIMISPNFINEVFNVKVWWDRDAQLLVITSGSQKNDGILRIVGDKFFMNGEPYYEISFNKFDLFYQLWAVYSNDASYPSDAFRDEAAEKALKQLHDAGFRSIRVFCTANVPDLMYNLKTKLNYYETMDKMFDLCDKYDIKIVACMGLISDNFVVKQNIEGYGLVNKKETKLDLVAYAESESRTLLAQYIKEFVDRYKARKTILMYEIVNEGNLEADIGNTVSKVCYSLGQLADFYKFCADTIKAADGQRVVTTGDAALRIAQYHLFEGTMAGKSEDDWTTDTVSNRLYALSLLNFGTDVISSHTYGLGRVDSQLFYMEEDGTVTYYDYDYLMKEAAKLGKPLYVGEAQVLTGPAGSNYSKDAKAYLSKLINAGVQLTHWWTFRSDRQGFNDDFSWRNDEGEIFDVMKEANASLKEKYVVNGVVAENTFLAGWEGDVEIIDTDKIVSGVKAPKETSNFDALKWTLIVAGALIAICVGVVILFRRRMKHGT